MLDIKLSKFQNLVSLDCRRDNNEEGNCTGNRISASWL